MSNIVGYVPCISINCYCMYPCICRIYYRNKSYQQEWCNDWH